MAQKSGFFNALRVDGIYDRTYNANDYCDNLAVVIGNGVLRSTDDDLKVTANGMVATVAAGRAWINGHYYLNDSPLSFAAVSAPVGGSRWDRVFLRLNTEVSSRSVALVYVQGEASNSPTKPTPIRNENIYDLVLADILVGANATSLVVTDTRADADLCGWVYSTRGNEEFFQTLDNDFNEWFRGARDTLSSVTLFKRYNWRTVLESASQAVKFSIPQWDSETCFLEVYVNGVLDHEGVDYTLNGETSVITFSNSLIAGTEIIVKVFKSIDGTGIESVADEITELQNKVAMIDSVSGYDYLCNGIDDNVKLSEIALEWLNGGADYGSKIIRIYGAFGATAPYSGSGGLFTPYKWFDLSSQATTRRLILDFSGCGVVSIPAKSGSFNSIFSGQNVNVIGANVVANNTSAETSIRCFDSTTGKIYAENCRFFVSGYKTTRIAQTGTFRNCYAEITSTSDDAFCIDSAGFTRIEGGEYYAYTGTSSAKSAIAGQSSANAVAVLYAVSAPTKSREGYYQTHSIYQIAGTVNSADLISALPVSKTSGDIRGTIAQSKGGQG